MAQIEDIDTRIVKAVESQIQPFQADIKEILKSIKDISHNDRHEPSSVMIKQDYKELESLRSQMRGMEILLQQNAALEQEVERLYADLDEVMEKLR